MTAALPRALSREIDTAAGAGTLLVAVDYDGTLAHLVTNPRLAVPDSKAARAVLALAELPRTPVAIVTGRDRDDLRAVAPALAASDISIAASHGADAAPLAPPTPDPTRLVDVLREVAAGFPGARVEVKSYGAALHTRGLPAELSEPALDAAVAAGRSAGSGRVIRGDHVVELTTSLATKGNALAGILDEFSPDVVLYIGDDTTDEDAFAALATHPRAITVKVGRGATRAQHRLNDVGQVADLLDRLLRVRTDAVGTS